MERESRLTESLNITESQLPGLRLRPEEAALLYYAHKLQVKYFLLMKRSLEHLKTRRINLILLQAKMEKRQLEDTFLAMKQFVQTKGERQLDSEYFRRMKLQQRYFLKLRSIASGRKEMRMKSSIIILNSEKRLLKDLWLHWRNRFLMAENEELDDFHQKVIEVSNLNKMRMIFETWRKEIRNKSVLNLNSLALREALILMRRSSSAQQFFAKMNKRIHAKRVCKRLEENRMEKSLRYRFSDWKLFLTKKKRDRFEELTAYNQRLKEIRQKYITQLIRFGLSSEHQRSKDIITFRARKTIREAFLVEKYGRR
eukprot:TRINITY_DN3626_c0_g1_i1.p1 TRINITY_DN3626_c0_g1~~TRINITY_DN3626_c0_g1_i1.p1  ORF type:complete len:312 (-),score=57.37 TRINITY_DN3626_c0_g1_i1:336-1271(-)